MWDTLYNAARKVQNPRVVSPFIEAGGVAVRFRGGVDLGTMSVEDFLARALKEVEDRVIN